MTWQDALEIAVARTGHERYRWLTSDENPDVRQRERYRANLIRRASPPNLLTQAKTAGAALVHAGIPTTVANAAKAIVRLGVQFLSGGVIFVDEAELDRRLAICTPCGKFNGSRCVECGCFSQLKARLESEKGQCPDGKW